MFVVPVRIALPWFTGHHTNLNLKKSRRSRSRLKSAVVVRKHAAASAALNQGPKSGKKGDTLRHSGAFINQHTWNYMKLSNLEPDAWTCSFLWFQVGLRGVSTSRGVPFLAKLRTCACLFPEPGTSTRTPLQYFTVKQCTFSRPWRGRWHRPGRRFLEKLCEAGSQTQTSNAGPQRRGKVS